MERQTISQLIDTIRCHDVWCLVNWHSAKILQASSMETACSEHITINTNKRTSNLYQMAFQLCISWNRTHTQANRGVNIFFSKKIMVRTFEDTVLVTLAWKEVSDFFPFAGQPTEYWEFLHSLAERNKTKYCWRQECKTKSDHGSLRWERWWMRKTEDQNRQTEDEAVVFGNNKRLVKVY